MLFEEKAENLYLVDLDQKITGFRKFISAWIYVGRHHTFVVDPGPSSTIPILVEALKALHITQLDYILLTHIHIDHAGGTGLLVENFPDVQVFCHPKGIEHMVAPEKLWQGSLEVLGDVARAYQPIAAVPQKAIYYPSDQQQVNAGIRIIQTPGHASHHISYLLDDYLFAGEVAGVNAPVDEGFYLRIATPPRFIYEIYKDSLDRVSQEVCKAICFGHYGLRPDTERVFKSASQQLTLWTQTVQKFCAESVNSSEEEIWQDLLRNDPCLKSYNNFEADIQQREKYFAFNSIRGMMGYYKTKNTDHTR